MITLKMWWVVKCATLFVTLFNGNSHLIMCETLHVCSHGSQHNISSCLTLSQFADGQVCYSRPNTTLIFNGGNHTLGTGIVLSDVMAFSMLSENFSAAVIYCHEGANMTFSNVSEVYIRGLTFAGCGGNKVHYVGLLKIEDSEFHGKTSSATSILISESNANITGTHFLLNEHGSYRSDIEYIRLHPSIDPHFLVTITVGGALTITSSTLSIDNCQFDRNSANVGGAVFIESESKVLIKNSNFTFNQAAGCHHSKSCLGGALYIEGQSRVNIYNSWFKNNTSDENGGIAYVFNATLIISESIVSDNTAASTGGAVNAYQLASVKLETTNFENNRACHDGGAVYLNDLSDSVMVNDCNFTKNRAEGDGGAIFSIDSNIVINSSHFTFSFAGSNGGTLINKEFGKISVFNSIFLHNHAQNDGGMIHAHASLDCKCIQCIIVNNSAGNSGGVLYAHSSSHILLQSSRFYNNRAYKGGVLCVTAQTNIIVDNSSFHGSIKVDVGAVAFAHGGAHVRFSNSTFTNNSALYGGVLMAINNNIIFIENCTLSNNEALGSGGTIYARTACTLVIVGSNFLANWAAYDGIVLVSDSSNMTAENSIFTENFAGHDGGAIHVYDDSSISINCCAFNNNRADNSGGAIYTRNNGSIILNTISMNNNSAQTSGGGINVQKECHVVIESSNFISNTADYGGVVHTYVITTIEILVSNFAGNWAKVAGGALATYEGSTIIVEHSNFTSNFASIGGVSIGFHNRYKYSYQVCDHVCLKLTSTVAFNECHFWTIKPIRVEFSMLKAVLSM